MTFKIHKSILLALTLCIFPSLVSPAQSGDKLYPKSYDGSDFLFRYEYDLTDKKFIIIRGEVTKDMNEDTEAPLKITVTGLDEKERRLSFGSGGWLDMDTYEPVAFEIKVPRSRWAKTYLFTYDYTFVVDSSGGNETAFAWFQDSPDPAFTPKALKSPPSKKREMD